MAIRFQGYRYFDINLSGYVTEEVTNDPRDLPEVLVYADNTLICRAVCYELSDKKVSLKDVVWARNARRKELRENLKDRLEIADKHSPAAKASSKPDGATTPAEYPKFKIKRFACDD
jgi:putative transposase